MKNRIIKRLIALIMVAVVSVCLLSVTVFAESSEYVPYENYTYWEDISGSGRKLVQNKPMYTAQVSYTAKDLGVEAFGELNDVCVADGYIYLLDSNCRIVVLNTDYKYVKAITQIKGDKEYDYTGAQNVYVHSDSTIYICDTDNKRVLHCDNDGNYIDMFTLPDSPLIPSDFSFQPTSVAVDSRGYVYILCRGSYYGALLYAPDKSFIGFYGANTVTNGILGGIQSLFNRMFPNNEKADRSAKSLPFSFNDIIIDSDDFVYTITDSAKQAQVKKLNPGAGNNIIDSNSINFADDGVNRTFLGYPFAQRLSSVAVDKNGFIYFLDSGYGRIYLYDADCRMLTAFGGGMGQGTQLGTFSSASALALNGDDVIVCDKVNNSFTVFSINDYGTEVKKLISLTLRGDYLETKEGWQKVLKKDRNLQVAYNGLARAYLAEKNYDTAMEVALEGYDRETYALAYKYQRKIWLSDNFIWLFTIAIVLIGAVITLSVIINKKRIVLIRHNETRLMFSTLFHPGVAFETIKDKHKGSLRLSFIILLIFYVTAITKQLLGGFLFTAYDPATFNSLWVFVQSMGLVVLWIISNILVCSLMDGKGNTKEIIVVTSYSLIPIIFERIIWTVLTNFLLPEEAAILSILTIVSIIWAGLLLITGMMRIHEYNLGKFVGTSVLSVLGVAAITFLMVLVGILLQQLGGFVTTVVTELLY